APAVLRGTGFARGRPCARGFGRCGAEANFACAREVASCPDPSRPDVDNDDPCFAAGGERGGWRAEWHGGGSHWNGIDVCGRGNVVFVVWETSAYGKTKNGSGRRIGDGRSDNTARVAVQDDFRIARGEQRIARRN